MTITAEQGIACLRRELALRQNVYPKWVAGGKKKKEDADHEIAALQYVHDLFVTALGKDAIEVAKHHLQAELLDIFGPNSVTEERSLALVRSIRNILFTGAAP